MDKYSWILLILVTAAILVCLLFREPVSREQPSLTEEQEVEPLLRKNFYDQIKDKNIEEAVTILTQKGQEARQIVPQFPAFPSIWLVPPISKGKYSSLGERYCIEFLELLFPGKKFKKIRPKWLRNPKTNRPLELDGFCEELMIAVEYNGVQHYKWPNFTHCSREEFVQQRERDQIKEEVCIDRNVCLIRIPYTVELNRIPLAIYSRLLDAVPELNT